MKAKDENYFFVTNWFYVVSKSVTPSVDMGETICTDSEKIEEKWEFTEIFDIFQAF